MDVTSLLTAARQKHSANAKRRRETTRFVLSWRSGGTSELLGYSNLAKAISVKETSIPVLFSRGTKTSFDLARNNPVTDEPDIVTVTRIITAKDKPRRGRPPKLVRQEPELLGDDLGCTPKSRINRKRRPKATKPTQQ